MARAQGASLLRRLVIGILVTFAGAAGAQQATEDFTVGDIRVEGLQRISEGTVFNYCR
jgi:outer membrane protein assembly factor BamA